MNMADRTKGEQYEIDRHHRLMSDPARQQRRQERRAVFTLYARLLKSKDSVFEGVTIEWLADSGLGHSEFFIRSNECGDPIGGPMFDLKMALRQLKRDPNDSNAYKSGMKALRTIASLIRQFKKAHP